MFYYCNSIQDVVTGTRRHAHISGVTSAPLDTASPTHRFKLAVFVFQSLSGPAPPYLADDCRLVSLTDRHLHSADIRTSVPDQTLGSRIEVSQPPVQKYGTVCRLHSVLLYLNNILNPTCLMRFETEALRDSCIYWRHINRFYVCMYVRMYLNVTLLSAECKCS